MFEVCTADTSKFNMQCYVEKFTSYEGITYFESGCKSTRVCSQNLRKGGNLPECTECCNTDYCNKYQCYTGERTTTVRCLMCNAVSLPTDCRTVTSCTDDETCFTQEMDKFGMNLYALGCRERSACYGAQIIGKRTSKCSMCCEGENCNRNLCISEQTIFPNSRPNTTKSTLPFSPSVSKSPIKGVGKDCKSLYAQGNTQSGIYRLSIDGVTFDAYCDMTGGGWTVIQRRVDGKVNFNRTWVDYENGFGNLSADYWLGLKNLYLLTKTKVKISFELLMHDTQKVATAVYQGFQITNASANYRMTVAPNPVNNAEMQKHLYLGNFYAHNGLPFTTFDRDNDKYGNNCANYYNGAGGFWYSACYIFGGFDNEFNHMTINGRTSTRVDSVEIKIM